ncbi:adenylate/guanylate cyclase domain-containing protein [Treponema pedis]|uniref:adenylate/guanylate cyclase domain-containing protein n=1 Tax=Treponema pedis TaxID=409322 RepID=UPI00041A1AC3
MRTVKKIFVFFGFLLLFFSCKIPGNKHSEYPVIRGVYNAENLSATDVIALEGDWIFVPNKFVSPSDKFYQYTRFEHINSSWTKYSEPEPEYGYATYAVKLTNLSADGVYAIKTACVSSAFVAYLNGLEFMRSGKPAVSKKEEVFNWDSSFMVLPTRRAKEAILVFHISNHHDKFPGFQKPVEIAFYSTLANAKNKDVLVFTILAGVLLVTSAFFISLYIFYPKEKTSLYFGLLCVNFGVRICCYDEVLFTTIIPKINSIFLFKLGYATFSLALVFASLFIHELFGKIKMRYLYIILFPAFLYAAINLFAPISVSTNLLVYAQIYVLAAAIYNVVITVMEAFKRNKYAHLFLLGVLVFLSMSIRDMLIANKIIEGGFLSHFGVLTLVAPMAIIVLQYFKTTSENVIGLAKKIELTNTALAKFVPIEFMNFLNKKHIEIRLGDNILKDMYIAFIHLGMKTGLETEAERLSVLQIYNKTLADINPVIEIHKGFIDKYLAEGLMVLFYGTAEDVIDCMLEIKEIIRVENFEREIRGIQKIKLACGVHYGKLMIGTIGEQARMDSTVISDAVNIASRLHFYALKKETEIFVSAAVKNNVSPEAESRIKFNFGGFVRFRGKEEPVSIYEVNKI